jgi:hypothetical protein
VVESISLLRGFNNNTDISVFEDVLRIFFANLIKLSIGKKPFLINVLFRIFFELSVGKITIGTVISLNLSIVAAKMELKV